MENAGSIIWIGSGVCVLDRQLCSMAIEVIIMFITKYLKSICLLLSNKLHAQTDGVRTKLMCNNSQNINWGRKCRFNW